MKRGEMLARDKDPFINIPARVFFGEMFSRRTRQRVIYAFVCPEIAHLNFPSIIIWILSLYNLSVAKLGH